MRANPTISTALLPVVLGGSGLLSQTSLSTPPNAPATQSLFVASVQSGSVATPPQPAGADGGPTLLTRQEAEKIALANNPRICISQLIARVQHQVVRERRADELPNLNGNLTAIEAYDGSRISSGSLTASRLLEHAGMGVQLNQLITDFGHTRNLVASAKLQEKARLADAEASRQDIVLATDHVFFAVIEAQETLRVATQTVNARQTLTDQVSALTKAKLKSDLDQSFAQVNLSQAKLLQLDAQNNLDAAKAALSAVLGYDKEMNYQLVDDSGLLPALPPDSNALIAQAIQNRPDLQSLKFSEKAPQKFTKAHDQPLLPTIIALEWVRVTPVGSPLYFITNWYGAVGGNVSIPIFDGFRLSSHSSEAALHSQSAIERTRVLRNL